MLRGHVFRIGRKRMYQLHGGALRSFLEHFVLCKLSGRRVLGRRGDRLRQLQCGLLPDEYGIVELRLMHSGHLFVDDGCCVVFELLQLRRRGLQCAVGVGFVFQLPRRHLSGGQ